MLTLAAELKKEGKTVVMSLHDLRVAQGMDLVVVLDGGRLRAVGEPRAVLTAELLREVFGVRARRGETLILELP